MSEDRNEHTQTFEDALADLLAKHSDEGTDTLISAMQIQIMALEEQEENEDAEN